MESQPDESPRPRDVSARNARIRFVEAGAPAPTTDGRSEAGPSGPRPPLLLLHDCGASHLTFAQILPLLAKHFHVIAPDLPGFGDSEKPDPQRYGYGFRAFSDSVFDLVAALGLGRVHVCGHGLGAGVALTLAAAHPALVDRLALVDPLVYPTRGGGLGRTGRVPVLGGLLFRQIMGRAIFRAYLLETVYAGAAEVPRGRLDELYEAFNAPAGRQALHATLTQTADTRTLVAQLPRVTSEALVVWGRNDALSPVEHGRRLARELRGRFEVVEDSGRCPPDEQPEAFARVLSAFLAPSPRGPQSSRGPNATPRPPRTARRTPAA